MGQIHTLMLRYLLFFSTLVLPFIAFSQLIDTTYNNQIKISALRLINILNPGIEISYERLHGKRYSSQLSIGYPTNVLGKPYQQLKGHTFAFEEKYFKKMLSRPRNYWSLDLNITNINFDETTGGMDTVNNISITDTFTIKKKMQSVAIKYGVQLFGEHIILDFSIGAGLKYRNVTHYHREFEYKGPREPSDFMRIANLEKKGLAFILPLNIRLGYSF